MSAREQIRPTVEGPLAGLGLLVEDVAVAPAGRRRLVRIWIDRASRRRCRQSPPPRRPLTLDEVADATRVVSDALDASDVMGEQPYTLEVTSPGVGRPLTEPRHFRATSAAWSTSPRRGRAGHRPHRARRRAGPHRRGPRGEEEPGPHRGRSRMPTCQRAVVQVEFSRGHGSRERRRGRRRARRLQRAPTRRTDMDIDLAALRALERERDISPRRAHPGDRAGPARSPTTAPRAPTGTRGSSSTARPATSSSGPARRPRSRRPRTRRRRATRAPRRELGPEFDDTPEGFGRVAAATARQVIVQRLRDIEDEAILGDFKGREGDVVAGVIQQSPDPRHVLVDFGTVEGILPLAEQVPGREVRARRAAALLRRRRHARACKGPQIGLSRTHPNLVRKLFALEVPEIADGTRRDRGPRPRGRPPHQDRRALHGAGPQRQGRLHRPDGRPGARRHDRAARREDRHRRLQPTTRRPSSRPRCRRRGSPRSRSSTASCASARVVVPDYQLSLAIGKEGQNARLAAKLTGWRIDIRPDTEGAPAARRPARTDDAPRRTPRR